MTRCFICGLDVPEFGRPVCSIECDEILCEQLRQSERIASIAGTARLAAAVDGLSLLDQPLVVDLTRFVVSSEVVQSGEFRLLLELCPNFVSAVSRALGSSVGELRDQATSGALTGARFAEGVLEAREAIKKSYELFERSELRKNDR